MKDDSIKEMIGIFVQLVFFVPVCASRNVFLICEQNCDVDNNTISGGEGDNIVLKYTVNITDFVLLKINYEATEFITLLPAKKKLKIQGAPTFIDISQTNLTTLDDDGGFEFSFGVRALERTMHGKQFISHLTDDDAGTQTVEYPMNVLVAPLLLDLQTEYELAEYQDKDISLKVDGNPKPNMTARIEDRPLDVSSQSATVPPYTYTVHLRNISRDECGKNMSISVDGYKGPIVNTTWLKVLFTPDVPQNLTAAQTADGRPCASVSWAPINTGLCEVNYTVFYSYFDIVNRTVNATGGNSTHMLNRTTVHINGSESSRTTLLYLCLGQFRSAAALNVTLTVRAAVNKQVSGPSDAFVVNIDPLKTTPAPPTTTPPDTTTAAATTTQTTTAPPTTITTTMMTPTKKPTTLNTAAIVIAIVAVVLVILFVVLILQWKRGKIRGCRGGNSKVHSEHHVLPSTASSTNTTMQQRQSPIGEEYSEKDIPQEDILPEDNLQEGNEQEMVVVVGGGVDIGVKTV